MTTVSALLAVVSVGLITYAARAGLILFLADKTLHPEITKALRFVGPAVLSALTISFIAGADGRSGIEGIEVAAIAAAVAVVAIRRNLLLGVGAGIATLWILLLVL